MKKNVKTLIGLMFNITLTLTMLGCIGEVYDGPEADVIGLLDTTWKTSETNTTGGKTVTVDKYMTFVFEYFTELTVTKTTQTGEPDKKLFSPESSEFVEQWTSTGLKVMANIDGKRPLTLIFSDGANSDFYVQGKSNEKYTKFDGVIPRHDLIGRWVSETIYFEGDVANPVVTGYYAYNFGKEIPMTRSKMVEFSNNPTVDKGDDWDALKVKIVVNFLQTGDKVRIKYETLAGFKYKYITIDKSEIPYSFSVDHILYKKK